MNTYTTSNQAGSFVAGLTDGKFVVTWHSNGQDRDSYGVYGQMYNADGSKYSSEFQVNTYTTINQWYPSVTGLNDGKFVVTWSSDGQDGDDYGIYVQMFMVNETLASSYLSSSQQIPESSSTAMPTSSIESLSSPKQSESTSIQETSSSTSSSKEESSSPNQPTSSIDESSTASSNTKSESLSKLSSFSSDTASQMSSPEGSSPPTSSIESKSSPRQSSPTSTQKTSSSTSVTKESSNSALITSAQSQRLSSSETGGTNSMVIILGAIIGGVCIVLCIAGSGVGYWLYRRKRDGGIDEEVYQLSELEVVKKETPKSSHKGVKPVGIDPQKLSKFDKIGRGAMGVVYKARYHGGDKPRDVAIKQMLIDLDDDDALRQLANEATLMEELRHPHIVQLLGYYQEQMNFNIVMEYVSGGELTKVLYDTDQAFPWPTRWDIAHDIANAVHYLHTNDVIQIIHRDLKSPNVLIYYQGARMRAKVADVGIAKVISVKETVTMTKGMGTPLWMAPEVVKAQGEGKKITYDEKVDVYSYGIILSELINRKEPFSEIENRFEVVPFVLRGGRPEIKETAPASFIALMEQCWAQRASDRPEMEEIVETLDQIEQEVKSFKC